MNIEAIFIQAKDCREKVVEVRGADIIIRKISSILQFTASDGFRSSFDALVTAECNSVECLIDFVNKKYKPDVAMWLEPRLKMLARFINGEKVVVPTCLQNFDELVKRLLVGILYVLRSRIGVPIILDDALSFITNEVYSEAFVAMMRPFIVSINHYLESRDLLRFNPIIITPGGASGFYRLARPYHYVVIFDHQRWELPIKDVDKIAYTYS